MPMKLLPTLALLVALVHTPLAMAGFVPDPPDVNARGYILMDYLSGNILAERNADAPLEPASLTKIMTSYVVFSEVKSGHLALDDTTRVSEKAWRTGGSKMFIEVGKEVNVAELIHGMVIASGNDASVALAEKVAGSEETFAQFMNQHAARLGMTHSHFTNATGLPHDGHITTAHDMARLTRALIHDFPEFYPWYKEKKFAYNGIEQFNRNKLLWRDPTVDGVKTGHTESAGFCLVSSAINNGARLIAVVMGTESENARAEESQKLLNYGFRFFETHQLYTAGQVIEKRRVWMGESEELSLGIPEDLFVTIPRGQRGALQASMNVPRQIMAPIAAGQEVGRLVIKLQDETVADAPLVAMEAVEEGGVMRRLQDKVLLMLE